MIRIHQARFTGEDSPDLYSTKILARSGERIDVEISSAIIQYQGKPAVLASARNISERIQAEKALRESEERFRALSEGAFDGVAIHEKGLILETNNAFDRIFGLEAREAIGKSVFDFAAPESRDTVINNMLSGYDMPYYAYGLRKDGSKVYGEMIGRNIRYKGRDARVTAIRDLTDRKKAENALRESEERYRTLVETSPDAIVMTDMNNKLVMVNQGTARLLGYDSAEEVMEKVDNVFTHIDPEFHEVAEDRFKQYNRTRGTRAAIYRLVRRDQNEVCVEVNSSVLADPEGNMIGVISVIRDITDRILAEEERRKLEEQIQHAQKLESLGILAGGIAHDFNNLLMGVLGNASLALLDLPKGSPVRHSVEQIEKTARAAADLTNQMLAYSGKGRFMVEPVDISKLVKDMAGLLKVSISKKVDLKFDFDQDLPPVEADAAQLRQVIMNLIINASEAIGDEPGVVSVRTGTVEADSSFFAETYTHDNLPEGAYVYLEVADSGCGMDQETIGRIFDPFFTSKFTGRGLGLAAVLGIVRGHKGAVRVQSEPGQGTTIRVVFPPATDGKHPPAPESRKKKPGKVGGKILVVDDEASIRDVTRRMLESSGFEVVTAKNGREAVETFKEQGQQIAGVLLDATMPQMDGLETFERLRRIRKDVRVVLSSGYSEQEATQRFTGKGLTGFIQKPYRYDDLIDKLHEVLGD